MWCTRRNRSAAPSKASAPTTDAPANRSATQPVAPLLPWQMASRSAKSSPGTFSPMHAAANRSGHQDAAGQLHAHEILESLAPRTRRTRSGRVGRGRRARPADLGLIPQPPAGRGAASVRAATCRPRPWPVSWVSFRAYGPSRPACTETIPDPVHETSTTSLCDRRLRMNSHGINLASAGVQYAGSGLTPRRAPRSGDTSRRGDDRRRRHRRDRPAGSTSRHARRRLETQPARDRTDATTRRRRRPRRCGVR